MPPTNVKGPRAPRTAVRRPSAGPAGPYPVVGPPRPTHHHPASLGPAGAGPFTIGPRKPLQTVQQASPAQRRRLVAQYTHHDVEKLPIARRTVLGLQDALAHPGRSIMEVASATGEHPASGSSHLHRALLPGATAQPGAFTGDPLHSIPALAIKNIGIATATHPGQVAGNTAKGLGEIAAGTPAGIAGLVRHPSTIGQLPSAIGQDFSRRYGPLARGDEKAFRQRIIKEGAAPELLDFTAVAGTVGATAGRALGAAAREGSLGARLQEIATVRPALRVSGGLARQQEAAPNLFRAVAQHGEDVARQRALGRRNRVQPRGVQPRPHEGPVTATGVAPRGAGEVVPLFQARAQRIAVSKRAARSYLANKREQHLELSRGVERDIAGLKPAQREGVFHVMSGIVPAARREGETDQAFFGRVKDAIEARRAQIHEHHAANPKDPKPVHPQAELHTLDRLEQNIPEVFGDGRLAAFHAANLPRSRRLAELDPGVANTDALRHPLRVQGETTGHPYEPPARLEGEGKKAHAERLRAYDAQYARTVRDKAAQRGLPEPAYFRHQEFPTSGFGARTAANLRRAVAAPKQSELKLFRRGMAITDPDVLVQGLAGNIKRRHQWNAVADTVDAHALPWSRKPNGQGRSVYALKREIQERGLNPDDFEFIDFRRFRAAAQHVDEGLDTPEETRGRLEGAVVQPNAVSGSKAQLKGMQGYVAVPKGVGEELNAALRPSGKGVRRWGKLTGIQSAAILGLNFSWLQMQVAANTLLFGLGTKGNLKDLVAGQAVYRDLPEDLKQLVDEHVGVGAGVGHATHPHLGSQGGSLAQWGRATGQIPLIRTKHGVVRVTDLNPTRPLFALDEMQNRSFRRAVLYNEAKRQAFKDMKRDLGQAATQTEKVAQLLRLKPGEKLDAQLRRVLENPQQIERLGDSVDSLLGNYLRYTSKERRFLKPNFMFYGFMRYALKTLFYTLPVKHPIAAAITGKLGQLHNEELRRLFGTRDLPPWVLSRLYETENGKLKRDAKGNPIYTDFARINPVTNPIVDVVQYGPKELAGLASPIVQAAVDQIYARSSFTGRGYQVHGSAEENPNPDLLTRGRIFGNQLLSGTFPYRELSAITQPGTQGSDTFLFSPRPLKYKTAGPQAQEAQRRANRPSTLERLKADLVPLAFSKPDASTEALIGRRGISTPTRPANTAAERERQLLIREAQQAQRETTISDRERKLLIREALAARG